MTVHPRKEVDSLYLERKAKVRYFVSTEDCQNSFIKGTEKYTSRCNESIIMTMAAENVSYIVQE